MFKFKLVMGLQVMEHDTLPLRGSLTTGRVQGRMNIARAGGDSLREESVVETPIVDKQMLKLFILLIRPLIRSRECRQSEGGEQGCAEGRHRW
jgi:hypothetical protein